MTGTEPCALLRRCFVACGGGETLTATIRLRAFTPGDKVLAHVEWQGEPPEPDHDGARRGLARLLRQMGAELGVQITTTSEE